MKRILFFACLLGMLISFASCEKEKKTQSGVVTFYGTVTESTNGEPISGVQITISGSDATPSSAVTGSDGSYELPITIIPTRKEENLRFVLVANKSGAVTYEAHDYLDIDDFKYLNWEYTALGKYYVAYGTGFEIGWDVVDNKVSQSFNIKLETE